MNGSNVFRVAALAAALGFTSAHAATPTVSPDAMSKINPTVLKANPSYDGFIVVYRNGTTERTSGQAAAQSVNAAVSRAKLDASALKATPSQAVSVTWKRKLSTGADLVRTNRKLSQSEAAALMAQIASDPAVAHVEPDVRMRIVKDIASPTMKIAAVGTSTPNDPSFAFQWHMRPGNGTVETIGSDTTGYANWGGSDASAAWVNNDGTGVVVAEIDTGVTAHPDLNTTLANAGYDFISDAATSGRASDGRVAGGWDTGDWTTSTSACVLDGSSAAENSSWHGTHVFGNIGEITNNGVGMTGVAPGAQVLPIRALGHCGGSTSDIVDAITWASGGHVDGVPDNTNPAQVISMSLGGAGACSATDVTGQAIAAAMARGTTVVVAAGNSSEVASQFSPASCPGVIAVSAVGITSRLAYYSNYGHVVTIAGPGGGILGERPDQQQQPGGCRLRVVHAQRWHDHRGQSHLRWHGGYLASDAARVGRGRADGRGGQGSELAGIDAVADSAGANGIRMSVQHHADDTDRRRCRRCQRSRASGVEPSHAEAPLRSPPPRP